MLCTQCSAGTSAVELLCNVVHTMFGVQCFSWRCYVVHTFQLCAMLSLEDRWIVTKVCPKSVVNHFIELWSLNPYHSSLNKKLSLIYYESKNYQPKSQCNIIFNSIFSYSWSLSSYKSCLQCNFLCLSYLSTTNKALHIKNLWMKCVSFEWGS